MIINGRAEQVLPGIPDGWADVIVTDPPYNEVNDRPGPRGANPLWQTTTMDKGQADSEPVDIPETAAQFVRVCRGSFYVWCGYEQISPWVKAFRALGLIMLRVGTWTKTNPSPANAQFGWLSDKEFFVFAKHPGALYTKGYASLSYSRPTYNVPGFPLAKDPVILRDMIEASSAPGARVLDPYMGSGTTGIACIPDREFLGIELDGDKARQAQRRIEDARGLYRYL